MSDRAPAPSPLRPLRWAVAAAATVCAYGVAEAGFRALRYRELASAAPVGEAWVTGEALWRFDPETGFGYRPEVRTRLHHFTARGAPLRSSRVAINRSGRADPDEDPPPGPGQWRIAILGDSFAAGINQSTPWPTLLERRLRRDAELLRIVGAVTPVVINLGLDGTGFAQWPAVARRELAAVRPDLVIVDFIADDIHRRFVWRRMHAFDELPGVEVLLISPSLPVDLSNPDCAFGRMLAISDPAGVTPEHLAVVHRRLADLQIARLPWSTARPELLAALCGDRLGLRPRLARGGTNPRFADRDAAIASSAAALRAIAALAPTLLVTHHPGWQEVLEGKHPDEVDALARAAALPIVRMLDRLPRDEPEATRRAWFLLPHNGHHSDRGNEVYAAAMHALVRERVTR